MNFKTGDYQKYASFIRDTENRYAIPRDLLAVTLWQASRFAPDHIAGIGRRSVGPRAALGIANLTGEDCVTLWGGQDKRLDPFHSIVGCAQRLRALKSLFNTWGHALLAYHSSAAIVAAELRGGPRADMRAREYAEQAQAACTV